MSPAVSRFVALRERSARDAAGQHVVVGVRFVVSASDHGASFVELLVAPELLRNVVGSMVARRLRARGVPTTRVDAATFTALFPEREPQGIAAIVRHEVRPPSALAPPSSLWVALSSVRSPGNLGTTLRTALATGASGLVAVGDELDPFAPDVVRASMGASSALSVVRGSITELRAAASRHGVRLVGASPDGGLDYRRIDFRVPVVLVLGAERSGLTLDERRACDVLARIPMASRLDSLNLAVAASVLLYEAYAQRHPVVRARRAELRAPPPITGTGR